MYIDMFLTTCFSGFSEENMVNFITVVHRDFAIFWVSDNVCFNHVTDNLFLRYLGK